MMVKRPLNERKPVKGMISQEFYEDIMCQSQQTCKGLQANTNTSLSHKPDP